jgi:hypothetical protein
MFKAIFENALKPIENATTKAMGKSRDKSQTTWRELVELSHRDKAQPEAWIVQRIGVDMGIPTDQAVSLFQSDVKTFGAVKKAISGKAIAEDRVQAYYDAWDVTDEKGFRAKRRLKHEELARELRELDAETKLYTRDVTFAQSHRVTLIQHKNNTRLFPDGVEVETQETTNE